MEVVDVHANGCAVALGVERYNQWSMYAFDTTERAVVGSRSREWTAVGPTELRCVQTMARCLRELGAGRWLK